MRFFFSRSLWDEKGNELAKNIIVGGHKDARIYMGKDLYAG